MLPKPGDEVIAKKSVGDVQIGYRGKITNVSDGFDVVILWEDDFELRHDAFEFARHILDISPFKYIAECEKEKYGS